MAELSESRKLDCEVAEKLFGWKRMTHAQADRWSGGVVIEDFMSSPSNSKVRAVPKFSSDDCFITGILNSIDCQVEIRFHPATGAGFHLYKVTVWTGLIESSHLLPEALCRVALRYKEIRESTP